MQIALTVNIMCTLFMFLIYEIMNIQFLIFICFIGLTLNDTLRVSCL